MLTLLSLGAGVQSTTLALMICEGHEPLLLDHLDGAIFADTGWEPAAVYAHLNRLEAVLTDAGIPLYRVSKGNLRADAIDPEHRYASVPYYVRNPDGSDGMGRRQCTSEYKLAPIRRKVRELLGAPAPRFRRVPAGRVAQEWVGFSADEIGRVNDKAPRYVRPRYPLIELGMDRKACQRWLTSRGWTTVTKSACIGCPYHGNAQWRTLRDSCQCGHHRDSHWDGRGACQIYNAANKYGDHLCSCREFDAQEWADAVAFDEAIRKGGARGLPLNGEAFLHRSRVPLTLAPIDRTTRPERLGWQTDIFDALAEAGDPDGCSPYGCRSGAPVEVAA